MDYTLNTRLPMYLLQRHPLTITAHFAWSLVLTYACPSGLLKPLLPPGLALDTFEDLGFVAIALVQTDTLRPRLVPSFMGQSFFLAGYRIFTKFKPEPGRTLRGLYILRSDTNRRLMATAGNLLTHYHYHLSKVAATRTEETLRCTVSTRHHLADLRVIADLSGPEVLPASTPFACLHDARRFAGPLPYTFDHERQTGSIIVIKGIRAQWNPRVVPVRVERASFLDQPAFAGARLASAFFVEDIPYQWNRGVRYRLN